MNRLVAFVFLFQCLALQAQDRPLWTESTQTITAGKIRLELGFNFLQNANFTLSGLQGDSTEIGILGLRIGAGERIELKAVWTARRFLNIDERFPAPNADILDFSGNSTSDVGDAFLATKIRVVDEADSRPTVGFLFGVELPNGSNERGLTNDETNFFSSLLLEKQLSRLTVRGNLGLAILGDPVSAGSQDDLLTYGIAMLVPVSPTISVVADWNGRAGSGGIGTEEQALFRIGAQVKAENIYWDVAIQFGFRDTDPDTGLVVGLSKDFNFPLFR